MVLMLEDAAMLVRGNTFYSSLALTRIGTACEGGGKKSQNFS
jgi:hypothetical protein